MGRQNSHYVVQEYSGGDGNYFVGDFSSGTPDISGDGRPDVAVGNESTIRVRVGEVR